MGVRQISNGGQFLSSGEAGHIAAGACGVAQDHVVELVRGEVCVIEGGL